MRIRKSYYTWTASTDRDHSNLSGVQMCAHIIVCSSLTHTSFVFTSVRSSIGKSIASYLKDIPVSHLSLLSGSAGVRRSGNWMGISTPTKVNATTLLGVTDNDTPGRNS